MHSHRAIVFVQLHSMRRLTVLYTLDILVGSYKCVHSSINDHSHFLSVYLLWKPPRILLDWNVHINHLLALRGFQSRFMTDLYDPNFLIDTPHHSTEGYIVNIGCDGFLTIFLGVCIFSKCRFFCFRYFCTLFDKSLKTRFSFSIRRRSSHFT